MFLRAAHTKTIHTCCIADCLRGLLFRFTWPDYVSDRQRYTVRPTFDYGSRVGLCLSRLLLGLSRTKAGEKYLAIDLGICALCGGFTVLSTKAFSSFLTQGVIDW